MSTPDADIVSNFFTDSGDFRPSDSSMYILVNIYKSHQPNAMPWNVNRALKIQASKGGKSYSQIDLSWN